MNTLELTIATIYGIGTVAGIVLALYMYLFNEDENIADDEHLQVFFISLFWLPILAFFLFAATLTMPLKQARKKTRAYLEKKRKINDADRRNRPESERPL